jgi:hypothetical protein
MQPQTEVLPLTRMGKHQLNAIVADLARNFTPILKRKGSKKVEQ